MVAKRRSIKVGCPFCWEWIPPASSQSEVFSPEGALGGRCSCGAAFVVDEMGRAGGQALIDAQAMLCDGDLDVAMTLETGVDIDVETRSIAPSTSSHRMSQSRDGSFGPKVWFVRRRESVN